MNTLKRLWHTFWPIVLFCASLPVYAAVWTYANWHGGSEWVSDVFCIFLGALIAAVLINRWQTYGKEQG